jgi:tRNA1(Val) A37 N6-methylase TrmN6
MYVSEIDPFNYQMAIKNVEQNELQDRIHGKTKHILFYFRKKR